MLQEHNVRLGFFERAEFLAFLAALPDYLQPVVTFAYFTGWRRGEIAGLKWHQVDLAANTVRIEGDSTKNKKARTIALEGELLDAIQGQWDKALKATGLAGKILHDFRRTAVRNMTRAGVPERMAMMVSEHKTRSVFDRYDIVSDEDLREAARKSWEHAQNQEAAAKLAKMRANQ